MLTGKQLKTIRQVAEFTGKEVADEMLVTKQTVSSIETGKTTTPSSLRYYELSLKIMVDRLDDNYLQGICYSLFDRYNEENGGKESFEIEDKFDGKEDGYDVYWYVVIDCIDEDDPDGGIVEFKGRNRADAIKAARSLKRCYPTRRIRVYNDFDF